MSVGAGNLAEQRAGSFLKWIAVVLLGMAIFGVTFYFNNRNSGHKQEALSMLADIQVDSQQVAKFAQSATEGDAAAFEALQAARARITGNVNTLVNGGGEKSIPAYGKQSGKTGQAVQTVQSQWNEIDGNIGQILNSQQLVLSTAQTMNDLTANVPQLQALLDEVVRAMTLSGSSSTQVFMAVRQSMLSDRMLRYASQIQQGGSGSASAKDRLERDLGMFSRVMNGFEKGDDELEVQALTGSAPRKVLGQAKGVFNDTQQHIANVLAAAGDVFVVNSASDAIVSESENLLQSARQASDRLEGIDITSGILGNPIGYVIGAALTLLGLIFLGVGSWREQTKRLNQTQALNQRNQEAILRLLDEIGALADKDMTVKATVTEDITGAIADSINFAVDEMRTLVETINETAVQVAGAAQETQSTAMNLADAAEHQAQQITSASAAINEIAVSIDEVSKNSAESAEVAQRSVKIAANGAEVVRQTINGMDSIRDQIQETSKRIKRLGESSQEIGSIVELINDISEQTNILALNASIQAASAGEAGRGFAVVADEVQRLAERASNATKRIELLVQTIQSDTNEAVTSMEQTTAEVVAGARLAEDAGLALAEIEKVSNDLADLIQSISEAARQQSAAATNISATMNVIQEITTQTSSGASQTAESIGNLAQLAANLRRSVADFKLPEQS